jgi:hypothetical protein
MNKRKGKFPWFNLFMLKTVTEKPSETSATPFVITIIIAGIFILHLPWWLCVIIIILGVITRIKMNKE